ncbi:MAG: FAD-dependent oxidoreductase [Desulfarculaceae bacterium]|nr:FAD-dependent oxidoreductase [Desulfarculaceae bacterium]MCF8072387.1 FAD-dependent oxidoreductase [Desulfarculaceae bacterium]MCF8100308.1 FAD-dependent oxidoreductase [Desulfarculaceae bacterium]MCF8116119.1 FAD-dependent oxidoreductase [Desulfarculaceae bacterium]
MSQRLVLAGAGHAHMMVLQNLAEFVEQGAEVTVIGPGPRHYYSGMGPGMLGGTYEPQDISFPVQAMVERAGGTFLLDKMTGLDPEARQVHTQDHGPVPYDLLSCNTGSAIPDQTVENQARIYRVKPIENLLEARQRIAEMAATRRMEIGVVGGGPAALEVAGNAWALARMHNGQGATVRVYAGSRFLKRAPSGVAGRARKVFARRGIEVIEGTYAAKVDSGRVELEDGRAFSHDLVFLVTGVKPRPLFGPSGLPAGPDGGLMVNQYLQCNQYPDIFGGGDCIFFEPEPLDKVGVYAVRQNPVLLHNLRARLSGGELQAFDPGGAYLLIYNLGGGVGILHKWGLITEGKLAFKIKDYIDRKFMTNFKPEWDE